MRVKIWRDGGKMTKAAAGEARKRVKQCAAECDKKDCEGSSQMLGLLS